MFSHFSCGAAVAALRCLLLRNQFVLSFFQHASVRPFVVHAETAAEAVAAAGLNCLCSAALESSASIQERKEGRSVKNRPFLMTKRIKPNN